MTAPELKPCPFCGGTDIEITNDSDSDWNWHTCNTCRADGPLMTVSSDKDYHWNRRSTPDADVLWVGVDDLAAIREWSMPVVIGGAGPEATLLAIMSGRYSVADAVKDFREWSSSRAALRDLEGGE